MKKVENISTENLETRTEEILETVESIKQKDDKILKDFERIVAALEATGLHDFIQHLKSPWRIIWSNFLAGIFRGLGILMGMSVVIGITIWILGHFVNFPLIGDFFQEFLMYLQNMSPETSF